jgi:membrane associated rhomboid family serine protease
MKEHSHFQVNNSMVLVPMALVLMIWAVYWVEVANGWNFNHFGIVPRSLTGLRGIVLSPFIHGSLRHLYNNTIPLAVLTAMLFYFYRKSAWNVLLWGVFISGLITWIMGRDSYHIGASGLIYVLASFIFFKGILTKYYRLVALSMIVVFLYGSLLWYIFPVKEGISWEGHLGGFLAGILLALVIRHTGFSKKTYTWEQEDFDEANDPFLKHFDADGNFIPADELEKEEPSVDIHVNYIYKKDTSNNSEPN